MLAETRVADNDEEDPRIANLLRESAAELLPGAGIIKKFVSIV
jgi:hypothetical protein